MSICPVALDNELFVFLPGFAGGSGGGSHGSGGGSRGSGGGSRGSGGGSPLSVDEEFFELVSRFRFRLTTF